MRLADWPIDSRLRDKRFAGQTGQKPTAGAQRRNFQPCQA